MMTQGNSIRHHHHADDHLAAVTAMVATVTVSADIVLYKRTLAFEVGGGNVIKDQVQAPIPASRRLAITDSASSLMPISRSMARSR